MATETFITDDDLRETLIASLQRAALENTGITWDTIIPKANKDAYNDILAALVGRGYTKEQIDQWDFGETYNRDIALYLALVKGGVYKAYDPEFINKLDRRGMLATVPVLINGEDPGPEQEEEEDSPILSGKMERPEDRFKY